MERYCYIMLLMLLITLHSACDNDAIRKIAGIPEKVNKTVNAILHFGLAALTENFFFTKLPALINHQSQHDFHSPMNYLTITA